MKFDYCIGNPPYQESDGGGTGDSAIPVYNKFVEASKQITQKGLTLIMPSRWMKGGKGLDDFRQDMMNDTSIKGIVDYEKASDCFNNDIHIDGGVCYFLMDKDYNGKCHFTHICADGHVDISDRFLNNGMTDTIIRDARQLSIIEKTKSDHTFDEIVSTRKPYGIATDLFNAPDNYPNSDLGFVEDANKYKIYGVKGNKGGAKRLHGYVATTFPTQGLDEIDKYKIFFSYAYSTTATTPPQPILAKPNEIATETFLRIGPFESKSQAENCLAYIYTKFFRALLFFNRGQKNASSRTFNLIPLVDFNVRYTDNDLYSLYNLTSDEINFIETSIKEMN